MQKIKKYLSIIAISATALVLTACSTTSNTPQEQTASQNYKGSLNDQIMAITSLSEHQREWKNTPYRLGGTSKKGIDCSGFMQLTFRDLFEINLPRTTSEQAKHGKQISKSSLRTGDSVFFNTGRGPNGKHVGVYVKNGQFLHASTKGGVIYSDLDSPYWSKAFWQARRL